MRLTVLSIALLATACLAGPVGVGDQVPDMTVRTLDGTEVNLRQHMASEENEGKIFVLASWSFKCPSGRPFLGYHQELATWCEENDVVYLAIAMYGEGREKIEKFAKTEEIEHAIAVDDDRTVADAFDTRVVNTAYVINAAGEICYAGGLPRDENDLVRQAVNDLKAGNEVQVTSSRPSG